MFKGLNAIADLLEKVDEHVSKVALGDQSSRDNTFLAGDVPVLMDKTRQQRNRSFHSLSSSEAEDDSDEDDDETAGSASGNDAAVPAAPAAPGDAPSAETAAAAGNAESDTDGNPGAASAAEASAPPANATASSAAKPANAAAVRRLEKQVAKVKSRYDTLKAESMQLEDLLQLTEVSSAQKSKYIEQLTAELAAAKAAASELERAQGTLQHQESELQALRRKAAAQAQSLAAATARCEALEAQAAATLEGNMLEALQGQLAAAQAKLDVERRAHAGTKAAAAARETDLQVRASLVSRCCL